ncbi:hypothetical protein GCM10010508_49400 [Streptomyces naganishii JCM 4654]|uniref:Uncharacterized protein n=2 Tax=Streptomyces naganishii TaxID=285447 RepID=A0A918Y829_9ACTN|nr:hypothetical protein GCM10010508_49400 [Streptomyces naganishii JCM 4654]
MLMRRLVTVGLPAVAAGGLLLASGGSATAATTPATTAPATTVPAATSHHSSPRHPAHEHIDPWVAGQLEEFEPALAKRAAVFDPWVKDQLALFPPTAR